MTDAKAEEKEVSQPDVFELRNSGLDTFLFANVGTEVNGSGLTILSVLARLGKDPWAEAALWAKQPRPVAVGALAGSIGLMPLMQSSLEDAHVTASRLIELLPEQSSRARHGADTKAGARVVPSLGWMMLMYLWLYLIMNMGMALAPRPNSAQATPAVSATSSAAPAADRHP